MRHHGLDLNLLIYLNALLEEQNVSKAAARLHVSQPTVSEALGRIRDFYRDEVLTPVGRRMVLTELGRSLIVPVRTVLAQAQAVAKARVGFDPAESKRRFTILASDTVADVLVDALIPAVARTAPGVGIGIELLTPESRELLRRGYVDLLIAPRHLIFRELPSERLWSDAPTGVVWRRNTLVKQALTKKQYSSLGHVVANINLLPANFAHASVERREEIVLPRLGLVPAALIGTNRVAIMPRRQALLYCRYLPLRIVKLPMQLPGFTEYLQWNSYQEHDEGLLWFRQSIRDNVGSYDDP